MTVVARILALALALVPLSWPAAAVDRPPPAEGCRYIWGEGETSDPHELAATTCFKVEDLDLVTDGTNSDGSISLGLLGPYVDKLRASGYTCEIEDHERGAVVDCTRADRPASLILDLDFEPTRAPELARVSEIRIDGVPIPHAGHAQFIEELIGNE